MKIEIKRTKISRSTIPQISILTQSELTDGGWEVVGWCRYKHSSKLTVDYVILCKEGDLRKLVRFFDVHVEHDKIVLVNNNGKLYSMSFCSNIADEMRDLQKYSWKILNESKIKGQFYL